MSETDYVIGLIEENAKLKTALEKATDEILKLKKMVNTKDIMLEHYKQDLRNTCDSLARLQNKEG